MPDEFYDDKISLTSYETPSLSLLAISAQLMTWYRIQCHETLHKTPIETDLILEDYKSKFIIRSTAHTGPALYRCP
jgi:hypothetical protein